MQSRNKFELEKVNLVKNLITWLDTILLWLLIGIREVQQLVQNITSFS